MARRSVSRPARAQRVRALVAAISTGVLACGGPAATPTSPGTARADGCSEQRALEVVRREQATYCAGNRHGCDFRVRARTPGAIHEDDPQLRWVVRTTAIHSFTPDGRPNFLPDGAIMSHVDQDCRILQEFGAMAGPPPRAPTEAP